MKPVKIPLILSAAKEHIPTAPEVKAVFINAFVLTAYTINIKNDSTAAEIKQ
ncbi:MAG: hypothetical protein U0L48_04375 [Acutalibacteraceae bacterium]|nr:hypothetical protein [Acutalibacteraceae bacterium]